LFKVSSEDRVDLGSESPCPFIEKLVQQVVAITA